MVSLIISTVITLCYFVLILSLFFPDKFKQSRWNMENVLSIKWMVLALGMTSFMVTIWVGVGYYVFQVS